MPVDIYEHTDYRRYLNDWFGEPTAPTARWFAEQIPCSPALVSAIRNRGRDLDPTHASAWSRVLGHDLDEARFFVALVERESTSRMRREAAQAHIAAITRFRRAEKVDDRRLDLYLKWYCAAILELAHCRGFRPDPAWIADRLTPPIGEEQAREALRTLRDTGLLVDGPDGALIPAEVVVTPVEIPPGKVSSAIREYHLSALERAARALHEVSGFERRFATQTIALPLSAVAHLNRRLAEVEQELITFCAEQKDHERVYQLAFLLFPVSRPTTGD